jgi:hypothetical protein
MAAKETDLRHLMDQARVKLLGASDAQLKAELYDVFHEFFDMSSSWTDQLTVPIVAGITTYVLTPDEGYIIRLAGVEDANKFTQPAIMPEVGTIVLRDPPNLNQTFTAFVVLNVVRPTTKDGFPIVPEYTLPLWGPGILDGLLGKMMTQPNKSYSDVAQGTYHLKRFQVAISKARVAALRRNTFGTQAWFFPQQWRTFNQRGGIVASTGAKFQ